MLLFKLILITFIFVDTTKSFSLHNFCSFIDNNQDLICKKHQCGQNVCSSDSNSCIRLKLWSNLMSKNKAEKTFEKIFAFFNQIKECKKTNFIRLSSIVCSNKLKCDRTKQSFFRNIIGFKPKECICSGRYKYDCGNEMCAINKVTCEFLFNSHENSTSTFKIKKCL